MIMRDFTKEINSLNNYAMSQIAEISYRFHGGTIKWYYSNNDTHRFLILICDHEIDCFVKSYVVIQNGEHMEISGYLGDAMKYGAFLLDNNNSLTEFYNTASEKILELPNPRGATVNLYENPKDIFRQLNEFVERETAQRRRDYFYNKQLIDRPRFFNHIRRSPISKEQYEYVCNILGSDVANYLRKHNLTAVFVKDPSRQRHLHILENGHLL